MTMRRVNKSILPTMNTIELNEAELAAVNGGDDASFWQTAGVVVGYVTYQVQQIVNAAANSFVSGANSTAFMAANGQILY